jgi:hypothetical protein
MTSATDGALGRILTFISRVQGGVRGNMKLGESGDVGRRNVGVVDESDIANDCRVGVGVANGLNKNVGDKGDMPTAHIDPIGETTNPGDIV